MTAKTAPCFAPIRAYENRDENANSCRRPPVDSAPKTTTTAGPLGNINPASPKNFKPENCSQKDNFAYQQTLMFPIKSRKEKIEFTLFILGIIGIIIFKISDNKSNREIHDNQGYAIGVLTQFDKSKFSYRLSIRTPTVKFTYCVKDSTFKGNYGTDTFPINEELSIVGKKYLVVYSNKDPNTARILLDYPVNDSIEFKKTVEAFTLNPDRFKYKPKD